MPQEWGDHHYDDDCKDDGSTLAARSCTDVICLLVFAAFLGGMGYCTNYGLKNGDPRRLTHGFNYEGKLCGVDAGVEEMPYLYYCPKAGSSIDINGVPSELNLKAPLCVAACPKNDSLMMDCVRPTTASPPVISGNSSEPKQTVTMVMKVVPTKSYASEPVLGLYCMPNLEKIAAIAAAAGTGVPSHLRESITNSSGPAGTFSARFQQQMGSTRRCWPLLCGSLLFAVILGYMYLLLMKLCAKPLIYCTLLLIMLMLFGASGFFLGGEFMLPRPKGLTPSTGGPTVEPGATTVVLSTAAPVVAASTAAPTPAPAAGTTTTGASTAAPISVSTAAPTPAPAAGTTPAPTPAPAADTTAAPAGGSATLPPSPDTTTAKAASGPPALPAGVTAAPTVKPAALPPRRLLFADEEHAFLAQPRRLLSYEEARAKLKKRWDDYGSRKKWEDVNPYYNEHMGLKEARMGTLITGVVFGILGLIIVVILCCAHNSIDTAIGTIKAATQCIFAMPCMLAMPAIEMAMKVGVFATLLVLFSFLLSSGKVEHKAYGTLGGEEIHGLRRNFTYGDLEVGMIIYYIVGIIWLMELTTAMGQFAISYAVVGWYYIPNPKHDHNWCGIVLGYIYACTVHLGSMALGAFLLTIFRIVIMILSAIKMSSESSKNGLVTCIAKILICCVRCCAEFVEFINKNAYVDICISSSNFCEAGKNVMGFIKMHSMEISFLHGACTIFSFSGICLISLSTSFLTYWLCISQARWTDPDSPHHVSSPRFVAFVSFIGAAFVAHAFMVVFDHTADTLLYTFEWNKSFSHNSVQRYAPEALREVTGYQPKQRPESSGKKQATQEPAQSWWTSTFGSGAGEKQPLMSPQ